MKKRILLISDVKGWGGWVCAEYIKKYLKDEFAIHLMPAEDFRIWEMRVNSNCFTDQDIKDFKPYKDKNFYNHDDFKKFIEKRNPKPFDLYYFLFHTMLMKKCVKRLVRSNASIMTIVTGFPTLKKVFYGSNFNYKAAKSTFLNMANKCKTVCANNYKSLEDLRTIYKGKSHYMPRGVDPKIFYPTADAFTQKLESQFTVAYVGKPVPEKGLKDFIKPACELANVRLIVNDRNFETALSPQEMNLFYNRADAYLVSSTIDGTPNPALEAASCGKPLIANAIGNMPEFIVEGVNGFMVERDVNAYANKLRWMKKNQQKAFEMGVKGREDILKKWTWEKVVKNHERKVFRSILC